MEPRVDLSASPLAATFGKHLVAADRVLKDSTLPHQIQELVKLRASQINGCAWCADMHAKDAAIAGETQARLNLVAAWRESPVFTEAERAALQLTEEATRIPDTGAGVADTTWASAASHYDEEQLVALLCTIALINAFNCANVIVRQPAGDYVPRRLA